MPAEAASSTTTDAWQRVSVVVVTHHSSAVIRHCLEPLGKAARIIIVDNASDDDTLDIVAQAAPDCEVLRNQVGAKVQVEVNVDPSLIGGLIVRVGSRMIDNSIRSKLQRLQLAMKGTG